MGRLTSRISNVLTEGGSLRRKIVASFALSTVVFSVKLVVRILSTVVLTRILTPDVFGIFAVVITFIFILEQFSDIGVRSLILTKEDDLSDSFLRSCWTAQILRGLLIFLVCCGLAFLIQFGQASAFFPGQSSYADPVLPYAVGAIGIYSIIISFSSTAKFVYEREMRFRQISIESLIGAIVSTLITISLALWLRSIWALVLGFLVNAGVMVVLSYVMFSGPNMRLSWNRSDFGTILSRGKWIVGHSALGAIMSVADRVILGLALPASSFGFYYIARQIVDLIEQFLGAIHAQMGLQVFTALQKDGDAPSLRQRYYRYRIVFDGIAMLAAGSFLTFAPTLVEIIYDDRYADVGGMIQIFAIGLILIGPGLLREAYSAQRRFREMTMLSLVRALTIWIGLIVAIMVFDSVTAALFVVALHRLPEIVILLWMGRSEGWVSWLHEIRLVPLVLIGAAMGWGMAELWQLTPWAAQV